MSGVGTDDSVVKFGGGGNNMAKPRRKAPARLF